MVPSEGLLSRVMEPTLSSIKRLARGRPIPLFLPAGFAEKKGRAAFCKVWSSIPLPKSVIVNSIFFESPDGCAAILTTPSFDK